MSALFGLVLAQIIDSVQAAEQTAETVHAQRNPGVRSNDNNEWSERQTMDVQEWLADPDSVDMVTVDTPAFEGGLYDPTREDW